MDSIAGILETMQRIRTPKLHVYLFKRDTGIAKQNGIAFCRWDSRIHMSKRCRPFFVFEVLWPPTPTGISHDEEHTNRS